MENVEFPKWVTDFLPQWKQDKILILAPNKMRKAFEYARKGLSDDQLDLAHIDARNQVLTLMDDKEGYTKVGLIIGIDFQPYIMWEKI